MEQLIFTDWPRGQGVDPAASGLQIKACSEGLSESERWQLGAISMHLGQAFTPMNAPRSAVELEQNWLSKAQDFQQIPAEVTAGFPVIWSCHCLSEHRYALTRTHYTCLTHDQRTGNFFAHTVVFDPVLLDEQHSNPLSLAQCGLFLSEHASAEISLPVLPDSMSVVPTPPSLRLAHQDPYRPRLAAMISALMDVTASRRPLLLCLSNWRDAEPLSAILLESLPPAVRREVTFCTFDIDRTWTLPSKSGKSGGFAHQLIVLCSEGNHSLNLRADEYQNAYAVFNFVEDRFSDLASEHPYAKFAAGCVLNGQVSRLYNYQRLLKRFGADTNRAAWDQLLAAEQISPSASPDIVQQVAVALAEYVAAAGSTAGTALELLKPRIQSLAQENDHSTLSTISSLVAKLVEQAAKLTDETAIAERKSIIDSFFLLAEGAFGNGQMRSAQALLKMCGLDRDTLSLGMLDHWANKSPASLPKPATALDQPEAFNLMLNALQAAEKLPDPQPPIEWLLPSAFYMAQLAGQSADAWKHLGDGLVKPRLATPWNAASGKLAHELQPFIHAEDCPKGSIWLTTKIVQEAQPEGKALTALLCDLTKAGAYSSQPEKIIAEAVQLAKSHFDASEKFALVLGLMANVVIDTSSFTTMLETYLEALKEIPSNRLHSVHRDLASEGAVRLLCRELLNEVLPWQAEESAKKVQPWRDALFSSHPAVLDEILHWLAEKIADAAKAQEVFPLAEELLLGHGNQAAKRSSAIALFNAVALALPLAPIPKEWEQAYSGVQGLGPEADARLRVLKLMRQVDQQSRLPNWKPSQFPLNDPAWKANARDLPAMERQELVPWCADLASIHGVTCPADARWLVSVLRAIGEDSVASLSSAVERMLEKRDMVTITLVTAAFADCALEDKSSDAMWLPYTRAILNQFSRDQRFLFVAYMESRFGPSTPSRDEKVEQLLVNLELIKPRVSSSENVKQETGHPVRGDKTLDASTKSGGGVSAFPNMIQTPVGILKKVLNLLSPQATEAAKEKTTSSTKAAQEPQQPAGTPAKSSDGNTSRKNKNKQHKK
jgi:hypothetical protein